MLKMSYFDSQAGGGREGGSKIVFKNLAPSLVFLYRCLTSCEIAEKANEPLPSCEIAEKTYEPFQRFLWD